MPAGSEEVSEDFPQQHSSLASVSLSEQTPCAVPAERSSADSTPASGEEEGNYGEKEEEEVQEERESCERDDDQYSGSAAAAVEDLLAPDKTATTLTSTQMLDQHRSRVKLFIENEKYLRKHHELGDMLELFVNKALQQQPENVLEFAGMFFTQPNLKEAVEAYSRQTVVRPDNRDKLYGS